jgi:hypothetical protein
LNLKKTLISPKKRKRTKKNNYLVGDQVVAVERCEGVGVGIHLGAISFFITGFEPIFKKKKTID